jgi:hypothetical protein
MVKYEWYCAAQKYLEKERFTIQGGSLVCM